MKLYRIAGLETVWVEAEIYESELPLVSVGQEAEVVLPYLPDKRFRGKVSFVYPYLSDQTRTGRVRIELSNPDFELRPDMYADVELEIDRGRRLVVPVEAVLKADVPGHYRKDDPFVGRIISRHGIYADGESAKLESLQGMSGGPIVGFCLTGHGRGLKLRLVAIQSHEMKAKDIIAGSRVAPLVDAAADAITD